MFDGNVIYEMNPVGEINVPQEDKKPNMNDDGKGKISIATGSSGGGVRYVECHTDTSFATIQCELSPEQIIDLVKNGENVVLSVIIENTQLIRYFTSHDNSIDPINETVVFSWNNVAGAPGIGYTGEFISILVMNTPDFSGIMGDVKQFQLTPSNS